MEWSRREQQMRSQRRFLEAVEHGQVRRCRAAAGRKRFEECFTLDKMIASYRQLYRKLMAAAA